MKFKVGDIIRVAYSCGGPIDETVHNVPAGSCVEIKEVDSGFYVDRFGNYLFSDGSMSCAMAFKVNYRKSKLGKILYGTNN